MSAALRHGGACRSARNDAAAGLPIFGSTYVPTRPPSSPFPTLSPNLPSTRKCFHTGAAANFQRTCKSFRDVVNDDLLWRSCLEREWRGIHVRACVLCAVASHAGHPEHPDVICPPGMCRSDLGKTRPFCSHTIVRNMAMPIATARHRAWHYEPCLHTCPCTCLDTCLYIPIRMSVQCIYMSIPVSIHSSTSHTGRR